MPIVQSLMDNLVAQYGKDKGERVYYAMEAEGKAGTPFGPGGKHRALHEAFAKKNGVPPSYSSARAKAKTAGKKKPPARGRRGANPKPKKAKRRR